MMELAWIVLDDSGSLTSYDERIRRIHAELRDELECSFDVTSWTTSSSFGMGPLSARPIGSGGGDGISKIFDQLITHDSAYTRGPCFIVYLTDGEANLTPDVISAIKRRHVVLIDILDPRWDDKRIGQSLIDLDNFLLHDCDEDCCECSPGYTCKCDEDACLASLESGTQPFYPNWARQTGFSEADQRALTDRYLFRSGAIERVLASGHIAYFDELQSRPPEEVVGPFRHPVDSDLNEINRAIDQCIGEKLEKRATLACDLNGKIKRLIGGNTLTPAQHVRIKATKYRIFTHLLDIPHETVVKTIYSNDSTTTPTEVQEGQPMSHAQITTTVSLKVASSRNATVRDLKTLITEVERVGGTDDSFVNLESAWRNGCLDAVVVVAVDVTEPELDPRVECVLSIEDNDKRRQAMLDLYRDGPSSLRKQIEPFLTVATKEKPAAKTTAKKTTQAKA